MCLRTRGEIGFRPPPGGPIAATTVVFTIVRHVLSLRSYLCVCVCVYKYMWKEREREREIEENRYRKRREETKEKKATLKRTIQKNL